MHRILSALAFVSALALPAAAHADTVSDFDLHGHGLTLSFSLSTSPTPDGHNPKDDFYIGDVAFTEDGVGMVADDVYFYNKPNGGGFTLVDSNGDPIDGLDFYGPKLFTGTVANPTFKEGTFKLTGGPACTISSAVEDTADAAGGCGYKLDITTSTSATPEPSSLLLLGSGALGTLGVLRRRLAR